MSVPRGKWGAKGTVPPDGQRKYRIGVHHTVSPNRTWTEAQEREHMRQLEAQHRSQGWSTVGYSLVIFPSGRSYVGRGMGLPAAQGGANSGSYAIAFVMNGDQREASVEARREARRVIRKLCDDPRCGIRQLGGHREFPGQATACPGAKNVPYMAKWRRDFGLARPS